MAALDADRCMAEPAMTFATTCAGSADGDDFAVPHNGAPLNIESYRWAASPHALIGRQITR
jgi:hypothetical protein